MSTKVTTGPARLSYCNVFKPRAFQEGDKEKYSVTLLIPKKDKKTLKKVKDAISSEIEEGMESLWNGKEPKNMWNPLRDGDESVDDHPEYEGFYTLNAKSDSKPVLLDEDGEELLDQSEIYSGCWARGAITFFAFNNKTKGVGVALNALKKYKDDEPFGSAMTVDSAKKAFDDDDDFDEFEEEDDF